MFNKKKKFFKEKLQRIERSIWDLEFKLAESRKMRESIRLNRDKFVETIGMMKTRLENITTTPEDKPKLEAELAKAEETKNKYERQMQMLDDELNGKLGTETQEGIQGANNQLESLVSLRDMTREYLRTI